MNRRGPRLGWTHALALCAVVLLAFAQVRSNVMRAAEVAPGRSCGMDTPASAMSGMAAKGAHDGAHRAPGKGQPACAYCADAAHAPIVADAVRLPTPSCVRWAANPPRRAHAPRGPPRLEPRARDPPAAPLTA